MVAYMSVINYWLPCKHTYVTALSLTTVELKNYSYQMEKTCHSDLMIYVHVSMSLISIFSIW